MTDYSAIQHAKLADEQFVLYTLRLLWENLGSLFLINLLCLLIVGGVLVPGLLFGILSALLLTALVGYPLLLGMMRVASGQIHNRHDSSWREFVQCIQGNGVSAAALGLFLHGFLYSYLTTTALVTGNPDNLQWLLLWVAQGIFFVLFLSIAVYALPLLSSYDLTARQAVHNGFLLAAGAPMATMAMLSLIVLLGLAVYWIGMGAWLLVPLVAVAFLCTNCQLQVEKRQSSEPS